MRNDGSIKLHQCVANVASAVNAHAEFCTVEGEGLSAIRTPRYTISERAELFFSMALSASLRSFGRQPWPTVSEEHSLLFQTLILEPVLAHCEDEAATISKTAKRRVDAEMMLQDIMFFLSQHFSVRAHTERQLAREQPAPALKIAA